MNISGSGANEFKLESPVVQQRSTTLSRSKWLGRSALLLPVLLLVVAGCARKEMVQSSYPSPPAPPPPPSAAPPADAGNYGGLNRHRGNRPYVELHDETYAPITENSIQQARENPVSTFSIDVDTGSYSNVRRMLNKGLKPPADAVRVEELINYFDYGYPAPQNPSVPFAVHTELAPAPWAADRHLLRIGIQGYRVPAEQVPAANLVFLVDTSGSMQDENKLPLLKQSLRLLVNQLRPQDRVSLVVYAGSAGRVLAPTPGNEKQKILSALQRLEAGGSTNGGAGIELAYQLAAQSKIDGGANWVILATDGDFNVGTVSQSALEEMVEARRDSGVGLMTLGLGGGNYNDAVAERLADLGNGQYAYIDTLNEARKVLVDALSTSLLTIASDVKIQVEFNPAQVAEYRLIGYENRQLRREDFSNDRVDAGEIGAGQNVTAIYELALVGSGGERSDPLRYASDSATTRASDEVAFVKLRYKLPSQSRSQLLEQPVLASSMQLQASESLRFAAAVVGFSDLLRDGHNFGDYGYPQVLEQARSARGDDDYGLRGEFLQLVALAQVVKDDPAARPGFD